MLEHLKNYCSRCSARRENTSGWEAVGKTASRQPAGRASWHERVKHSTGTPVAGRPWGRLLQSSNPTGERMGMSESMYMNILEDASIAATPHGAATEIFGML